MTIITHRAKVQNWIKPEEIQSPRTLVLGSFNPYNPNGHNDLDYYYGRKTNYFWKIIGGFLYQSENYFFDPINGLTRKRDVMDNKFCCMDIIESLELTCGDENILKDYIENKIFKEFSDGKIWVTKTNYCGSEIIVKRNYNPSILKFLKESDSITKVINTMGVNRISSFNSIEPVERNGYPIGFKKFIQKVISTCEDKNIEFEFKSISPSQISVNQNNTIEQLRNWLTDSLKL